MYIICVYDICVITKEGRRRLNKIFKLCKQYLSHIQNSVFEGEISVAGLEKFKIKLENLVNKDEDTIIIFKSNSKSWLEKTMIGKESDKADNFI